MNIPQLIYTMHTEFWIIKLLIKAEVAGIVTKNDKIEEIEKAIHNILHEGNKYYSPTALNVVLSIMGDHSTEKSITYTPSPRENEIIQMLSCGLTSDEIAHKLNLSKNTIDTMRKNILLKKWGYQRITSYANCFFKRLDYRMKKILFSYFSV